MSSIDLPVPPGGVPRPGSVVPAALRTLDFEGRWSDLPAPPVLDAPSSATRVACGPDVVGLVASPEKGADTPLLFDASDAAWRRLPPVDDEAVAASVSATESGLVFLSSAAATVVRADGVERRDAKPLAGVEQVAVGDGMIAGVVPGAGVLGIQALK